MDIRHPEIEVVLSGADSNVYSILGIVRKAMHSHRLKNEEIQEFMAEAMSGDYDHVITTIMQWVTVD